MRRSELTIPAILIREEPQDGRREERWRVRLAARWLDSGITAQSLTIHDLSYSGFLLETDQPLKIGSCLVVEMPGDITKICKTVWNSGKLHGATFSKLLSDAELRDLISSSSVIWPTFRVRAPAASIEPPIHPSPEIFDELGSDDGEKFPIAIRLMIIIGTSAALWALIGVGIWVAFR